MTGCGRAAHGGDHVALLLRQTGSWLPVMAADVSGTFVGS